MRHFVRNIPDIGTVPPNSSGAVPINPVFHITTQSVQPDVVTTPSTAGAAVSVGGGALGISISPGGAPVAPAILPYATEVLNDGPILYLPLTEPSGLTMTDLSGNARNGTYTSGAVTLGATGPVTNLVSGNNSATLTNATTANALGFVSYASWMNVAAGLTYTIWVKSTNAIASRQLWTRTGGGASFQTALQISAGVPSFFVRSSATIATATGSATINDGNWHRLDGTWDNTTLRLYVDGAQVATAALAGTLGTDANPMQVGGRSSTNYTGTYAHAAYYDKALSAARIATQYAAATA